MDVTPPVHITIDWALTMALVNLIAIGLGWLTMYGNSRASQANAAAQLKEVGNEVSEVKNDVKEVKQQIGQVRDKQDALNTRLAVVEYAVGTKSKSASDEK